MHRPDTSTAAIQRQRKAFRLMTPEYRLALAAEMSDEIRALAEFGIRHRHPDFSDDEVREALVEILLGQGEAAHARAGHRRPPHDLAALLAAAVGHLEAAMVPTWSPLGRELLSRRAPGHARPRYRHRSDPEGLRRSFGARGGRALRGARVALAALDERTQFNAIDSATGWKVDFIVRKDRPFSREELTRRTHASLLGTPAWIASPEDGSRQARVGRSRRLGPAATRCRGNARGRRGDP